MSTPADVQLQIDNFTTQLTNSTNENEKEYLRGSIIELRKEKNVLLQQQTTGKYNKYSTIKILYSYCLYFYFSALFLYLLMNKILYI